MFVGRGQRGGGGLLLLVVLKYKPSAAFLMTLTKVNKVSADNFKQVGTSLKKQVAEN